MLPVPAADAKFDNGMYVKLLGLNLGANLIPSKFWRLGAVYNYRAERDEVENSRVDDMAQVSDADDGGPVVDEGSEIQLFTAVLVVFKF